jgi:hypothetical protein
MKNPLYTHSLAGYLLDASKAMVMNHSGVASCGMEMSSKTAKKDCCSKAVILNQKEKGCTGNAVKDYVTENLLIRL